MTRLLPDLTEWYKNNWLPFGNTWIHPSVLMWSVLLILLVFNVMSILFVLFLCLMSNVVCVSELSIFCIASSIVSNVYCTLSRCTKWPASALDLHMKQCRFNMKQKHGMFSLQTIQTNQWLIFHESKEMVRIRKSKWYEHIHHQTELLIGRNTREERGALHSARPKIMSKYLLQDTVQKV
jgi:hypothetical protein